MKPTLLFLNVGIMSSPIEDFFRNPVLHVSFESSDRVKELEAQVEHLTAERDKLMGLYTRECDVTMRLADVLHQHGIRWR